MMKTVSIMSRGGTGFGTEVRDMATDSEVHGVSEIDISIRPDEVVRAEMTILMAECTIEARAEFLLVDPATGERKAVDRICFTDGSTWSGTD